MPYSGCATRGLAFAPEMLPRIFDLFVQADHAAMKSQGGLGIGLTLVKNLVEMQRGKVEARSAGLGQGSEFVVRLPLAAPCVDDDVQPNKGPQTSRNVHVSRQRLVVVDDNVDAAESLAMVLRLKGHEVRVAHDGPSALSMIQPDCQELVFLDIGMPGMDGNEVARRIAPAAVAPWAVPGGAHGLGGSGGSPPHGRGGI